MVDGGITSCYRFRANCFRTDGKLSLDENPAAGSGGLSSAWSII
jgi:hypothetical protein